MNNCKDLIQFDTFKASTSLTDVFSVLNFIEKENYDSAKTNASLQALGLEGYLAGDFENFNEKKSKLRELFSSIGYRNLESYYYHHVLNSEGAKAYAECLRINSNNPLSIWIDEILENEIIVGVKNGMGGNATVEYEVVNDKPLYNQPAQLLSGSEDLLVFNYDANADFMVIIKGKEILTNQSVSCRVSVPKKRNFEIRHERKEISGHVRVGAGGYGSIYNNQYMRSFTFTADPGFYLLPDTLRQYDDEKEMGPGVMTYNIHTETDVINGEVKRLNVYADGISGASRDTMSIIKIPFSIIQEDQYLVEVKN